MTERVREEHRQALEWLNRRTDAEVHFFLVVVELIRIDDSRPAVVFKPVVSPNEWQRTTREAAERQPSMKGEAYRRYFQVLIDELRDKHRPTGIRAALPQNWHSFQSGIAGVSYGSSFALGGRVRAEVYIDFGEADRNEAVFDRLYVQRSEIEASFGGPLEWERLDDRRACRIAAYRAGAIQDADTRLQEIRARAIERLLKLRTVFGSLLQRELRGQDGQPVPSL
ncbi:DUF4268 domain-containing protein [Sorangium cellulosum]|nr:DUF4268 domain-containing protein [Sorangium cellulosum]